ncbi:hypothetical protein RBB50_005967 [Rhinocladiella similis]
MSKLIMHLLLQYYAILILETIISFYCSPNNTTGYVLLCELARYLATMYASTTSSAVSSVALLSATFVYRFMASGLPLHKFFDAHLPRSADNSTTTISNDDDTHLLQLPGSLPRAISIAERQQLSALRSLENNTGDHKIQSSSTAIKGYAAVVSTQKVGSSAFGNPNVIISSCITAPYFRFTMTHDGFGHVFRPGTRQDAQHRSIQLPLPPLVRIEDVDGRSERVTARGNVQNGNGSKQQRDDRTQSSQGTKSNDTDGTGRKQSSTGSLIPATSSGVGSGSGSGSSDDDGDSDRDDNDRKRGASHHTTPSSPTSDSDSGSDSDSDSGSNTDSDSDSDSGGARLVPDPAFGSDPSTHTGADFDLTPDPGYIVQDEADDADVDTDPDGSEFRYGDSDSDSDIEDNGRQQGHAEEHFRYRYQDHLGRRMAWDWSSNPQP